MKLALALVALAGCSNLLGIEDLSGPNAPGDGNPGDVMVAPIVEIVGTVQLIDPMGTNPVGGALIELVRMPDRELLGETSSGAGGAFEIEVATEGRVLDAYLRIGNGGGLFRDTYCYPPPLTSSITFDPSVFSQEFITFIAQQAGQPVEQMQAFVVAVVLQPGTTTMAGRAGVRITTPNGDVPIYAEPSGLPNPQLTSTSSSGIAYLFNADPSQYALTAAVNGLTVGQRQIDGQPATAHFVPIETN